MRITDTDEAAVLMLMMLYEHTRPHLVPGLF